MCTIPFLPPVVSSLLFFQLILRKENQRDSVCVRMRAKNRENAKDCLRCVEKSCDQLVFLLIVLETFPTVFLFAFVVPPVHFTRKTDRNGAIVRVVRAPFNRQTITPVTRLIHRRSFLTDENSSSLFLENPSNQHGSRRTNIS